MRVFGLPVVQITDMGEAYGIGYIFNNLARGINIEPEIDESTGGPASFMVIDPDGNQILIDQHV